MLIHANLKKILSICALLSIYSTIYILHCYKTTYKSLTDCTNTSDIYAGCVTIFSLSPHIALIYYYLFLYLDIGRAPYFPYTAVAEPLSLLSLDAPPPVFLPIQYVLPTIRIPLWYASPALHSSLHSQCTVDLQQCTVDPQQCTVDCTVTAAAPYCAAFSLSSI